MTSDEAFRTLIRILSDFFGTAWPSDPATGSDYSITVLP